jgi:hypothetical protein
MQESEINLTRVEESFLDAMLDEAINPTVNQVADRLRLDRLRNSLQSPVVLAKPRSSYWRRSITIAVAASLLIAAGYFALSYSSSSQAYAAVTRAIEVKPTIREYNVHMVHRLANWGDREVDAQLFVNDANQFVVHHPGWRGFGDLWIGGDRNNRWLAPRFGPAYIGDENMIGGWLANQDLPSPYLHTTSALDQMRKLYRLKMLRSTELSIDDGTNQVRCNHVVGNLKFPKSRFPHQIELWADETTNVVYKLEFTWDREEQARGPVKWTVTYKGQPNLNESWFTLAGHIHPSRRIVNVTKPNEIAEPNEQTEDKP